MVKEETTKPVICDKNGVIYFHYKDNIYFGFLINKYRYSRYYVYDLGYDLVYYKYDRENFKEIKI